MVIQFDNAKQYASYLSKAWGRAHVAVLNKESLEHRLSAIKNYSERYTRDIYGDGQLPFGYSPASYGLWWVVTSGRVNGAVYGALKAMTVRQLCELVHLLLVECGDTTSDYARFLMERYKVAA